MILAVESSCDESAIALLDPVTGNIREWLHSQIALHQQYGGVVPDLASREHLKNFPELLRVMREEGALQPEEVDRIAVTRGPGLAGCLAIGGAFARSLALAWKRPLTGVNHLRAHAWSPFISPFRKSREAGDQFAIVDWLPHVGLLVSGGNTLLFVMDREFRIRLLGQTVDDAAGEALDKGAKLLGLPYPGGPEIERQAAAAESDGAFAFPTGRMDKDPSRFSFSGLKTSLRYQLEAMEDSGFSSRLPTICHAYQAAVVRQLTGRTRKILSELPRPEAGLIRSLGLSGGVANNQSLRAAFSELAREIGVPALIAEPRFTGDNASMVAFAAWMDSEKEGDRSGKGSQSWEIDIQPSLTLTEF